MANSENLIPMNKRSKNEVRELASKGGKASGEARRRKKTLKEYAEILMSLDVKDARKIRSMEHAGIPEDECNNKMLVAFSIMRAAQAGDVQAARELRSILGEDKAEDMTAIEKLDELLAQISKGMKND